MTAPEEDVLGPKDQQGIGTWAERGLLNSDERQSAERAAVAEGDDSSLSDNAVVDEAVKADFGGKPGSVTDTGDEAERAAFLGHGVYSQGQFAGSDLTTPSDQRNEPSA